MKSEEQDDIEKTLAKLPKSHANLVKGFDWKFHKGNTLDGDNQHVGYVDKMNGEIAVAAPWNYGREFTVLHEIGHQVWDRLPPDLQEKWKMICSNTKAKHNQKSDADKALDQSEEELFCMSYATNYCKHKIVTYYFPEWMAFIKSLPQ